MQPFEFLSYEPTHEEKYLGIATVRAWGKIILKFKITQGTDKNGDPTQGFFFNEGAFKNGTKPDGKDKYDKYFMIDSNYEKDLLDKCIRANVFPFARHGDPIAQNSGLNQQNAFGYQGNENNRNFGTQGSNSQNYSQQFTQPVPQQQTPNGNVFYKGQWIDPSQVPASERLAPEAPF